MLKPVHPNAGIRAMYFRRIEQLVDAMAASVRHWLVAAYRANEPAIAADAISADALKRVIEELRDKWLGQFDEAAEKLADHFAQSVQDRSDAALRKILREGGFSVKFKMTAAQRDVLKATVQQNVALIKSIPQEYFTEVEGMVMRSVQTGRDLEQLNRDLLRRYDITKRRAALIARDQNNKATSALNHARQKEVGIRWAVWMHSHAGKKPRPTHVKMNGRRYDISKGMWDPAEGEYVFPGQLINCRCTSRPVIAGFE